MFNTCQQSTQDQIAHACWLACNSGQPVAGEIVELFLRVIPFDALVAAGNRLGVSAAQVAAIRGNVHVMKVLLENNSTIYREETKTDDNTPFVLEQDATNTFDFSHSKAIMEAYRKENNSGQPCKHKQTNTYTSDNSGDYDTCAACREVLSSARIMQEHVFAAKVEMEDVANGFGQQPKEWVDNLWERGVRLDWLIAFTFSHDCWDFKTYEVVRDIIRPGTVDVARCRYADLPSVKPFTGGSTVFASHAWGAKWGDLVLALARSVPLDAYVWVDVFAVRQWPGNGADLDFKGVIKRSTAIVVAAPTTDAITQNLRTKEELKTFHATDTSNFRRQNPVYRLWCFVELSTAAKFGVPIVMSFGTCVRVNNDVMYNEEYNVTCIRNFLNDEKVDVRQATTTVDKDRTHLNTAVEDAGGHDAVNNVVRAALLGSLAANINSNDELESILAAYASNELRTLMPDGEIPSSVLVAPSGGINPMAKILLRHMNVCRPGISCVQLAREREMTEIVELFEHLDMINDESDSSQVKIFPKKSED